MKTKELFFTIICKPSGDKEMDVWFAKTEKKLYKIIKNNFGKNFARIVTSTINNKLSMPYSIDSRIYTGNTVYGDTLIILCHEDKGKIHVSPSTIEALKTKPVIPNLPSPSPFPSINCE